MALLTWGVTVRVGGRGSLAGIEEELLCVLWNPITWESLDPLSYGNMEVFLRNTS